MTSPYQVIYIGPYGFSGSTLLDLALAQSPVISSGGELFQLAEWARDNRLCTCRRAMENCDFWSSLNSIGDGAALSAPSSLSAFWDYSSFPMSDADALRYARAHWQVFDEVAKRTNARYVVDSSKHLWRLRALVAARPGQVRYLHLMRNPVVVAKSAAKAKARPAIAPDEYTSPVPVWKTLAKWVLTNRAAVQFARREELRSLTVSYEQLSSEPAQVLEQVCGWLDMPSDSRMLDIVTAGHHNIAGSRWRLEESRVTILPDKAAPALSPTAQRMARYFTALTGASTLLPAQVEFGLSP